MSIEVQTADATAWLRRTTSLFEYDGAYTVLFRIYLPSGNPTDQVPWMVSSDDSWSGGGRVGTHNDSLRWKSNNDLNLESFDGTNYLVPLITSAFSSGWQTVAIIRSSLTTTRIRANGETQSATGTFVDRPGPHQECMLGGWGATGQAMAVGTRITNYKCWTEELDNATIDAEALTTTVSHTSGFFSQSPMSDASTLAGNLTQSGSSSAWTTNSGIIAGANDPSVTYGGAANALVLVERGRGVGRGLGRGIF